MNNRKDMYKYIYTRNVQIYFVTIKRCQRIKYVKICKKRKGKMMKHMTSNGK